MMKTYISALLIVLVAGAQMVQAKESVDDVLAQLNAAEGGTYTPPPEKVAAPVVAKNGAAGEAADVAKSVPAKSQPQEAVAQMVPSGTDALDRLLDRGVEFYKQGKFDEALAVFDTVLSLDRLNGRANSYKMRIAQRLDSQAVGRKSANRVEALSNVESAWTPESKKLVKVEADNEGEVKLDADAVAVQKLEARLKAITIPSMDFTDAPIGDVIDFLSQASRSGGGSDVDFLMVGDVSDGGGITVSIRDMSLYETLQFVVGMASLKFEVLPSAVAIMPVGYVPLSALAMESFDVSPSVGDELGSAASDSDAGADNLFGDDSGDSSDTGVADVAAYFSTVDFPEGASAIYHPKFHKLFVKNTPDNLKAIKGILGDLEEEAILRDAQQVEIETKFVEFSEGALEELGFDWNVYGNGTVAGMQLDPRNAASTGTDPNTGQPLLQNGVAGDQRPGQNLLGGDSRRTNVNGFETVKSGLLGLMGGSPGSMMVGNGDVDLMITALEQSGNADVLSAPRVTTKSGSEATIRVAETHRYPQDYDVETGQRTSPVVKPQDWEDFDLGVSLKVTPVVNPDSGTIDLDLQPQTMKYTGMDEYTVGFNLFDSSGSTSPEISGDGLPLIARMPYFERRSVQSQVTIDDGQTVVMGGMVDERTEEFSDQVPILGDIPYLGRLFRNEGTRSYKRNLVVYVKASIVDQFGMTRTTREAYRQANAD